ncbi:MAG TPA: hypothetical protein VMV43_07125 [Candidatus Nanopelagicaceae bacterium]|nr:hypothetical protein [Candidatus Nanopelagicaceae bacterium]
MEKKGLGVFLTVLGVIFLGISGITIWSNFCLFWRSFVHQKKLG